MSLGLLASLIKISILSYTDFFLLVVYLKLDFFSSSFCYLYVCVSSFMSDVLRIISECQLCPSIVCFSFFFLNHHHSTNTFTCGTLCVTQSH